jgi:hypothetical protein
MRRRSLCSVLLAVGLGLAGGATLSVAASSARDDSGAVTFARADLTEVVTPTAVVRARDGAGHAHPSRDLAVVIGLAALLVAGIGWWLALERRRTPVPIGVLSGWPSRAPPALPFFTDC